MAAFAHIAVATLFNSLWEAAVLAIVVSLALRLLPNVNATTRYAAWCIALAGSFLLPLATAIPQVAAVQTTSQQAAPSRTRVVRPDATARHNTNAASARTPVTGTAAAPSFRLPSRLQFTLPESAALAIFAVWGIAALLFLVRLAFNLWKLERLKSDALPLPVAYRERLERWARAEKGEREVRLCTCETIEVPVAVGLFDSMILIPAHLLQTLSENEIDQIILHELAHLRRADDWTNGLQRIIQALFFFNPAVLYVAQQLDLEREVACDDWVVDQTKEVRPYATCLTKMAEVTAWPHRPLAAPGVFVTRRGLSVRVERLLRVGRDIRTSISFGPAGTVAASLIVLFFLLQTVAPSFAFTLPAQQSAQHAVAKAVPTPTPRVEERYITIPATHIHMPARTIHVPAVNVDIPERHLALPNPQPSIRPPHVRVYFPSDFGSRIASEVNRNVSQKLQQAFSGKGNYDCMACDYSGQNLAGHNFHGMRLTGADFSHANLRNADFSNTVLTGVDFSKADLRGASFAGAALTGCDLSHAQLGGTIFTGVTMTGCDVDARDLSPQQAGNVLRGCRTGCDFSNADLRNQDLRGLNLSAVDLERADLRGADLSGSTFRAVDFEHANFDGARVDDATFSNCGLDGVDRESLLSGHARIINGGQPM
jgi:uncharacterized protein YjbI with pentapeptide repeats/beta-lactamase regulating signal transducer with metallopeptidase domain